MKKITFAFLLFYTFSYGGDLFYQFGRGLNVDNHLWLGSYISINYWKKGSENEIKFDDIALLSKIFFGKFSLFSEFEANNIYVSSSSRKNKYWDIEFEIERIFLSYHYNDFFNIKIGRFLTPLGIWNKIHIDALKWTVSDPLVSTAFFPMFTTGININGYFSIKENIKYEFFIQKNKSINSSYNNLKTEDIIGFQVEKLFDINKKIGINGGIFEEEEVQEEYKFLGLYGKTKIKSFFFSSEVYYANEKSKKKVKHKEYGKITYYLQLVKRIFNKTYFIFRKDGLYDTSDKHHVDIWTFTLNFRPRFNISFKVEYQLYERKDDYIRSSFAVLF